MGAHAAAAAGMGQSRMTTPHHHHNLAQTPGMLHSTSTYNGGGQFGNNPTTTTPHYNLSSPLYLPLTKGYPIFKESPKFQLNFMNSQGGNVNAHFYGSTGGGAPGNNGAANSEMYPN